MAHVPSDIEIAQQAKLRPIVDVAAELGLGPDDLDLYGKYKAKISLDIAERPGGISLSRDPLVGHRIHAGCETSASIDGGERYREDLEVFERLWPGPVARALATVYARAYHSNEV